LRSAFVVVIGLHALLHLLGFIKAFGLAPLPQLHQAIAQPLGVVWLVATLSLLATLVALFLWPSGWWALGAAALALSQLAIMSVGPVRGIVSSDDAPVELSPLVPASHGPGRAWVPPRLPW
jgi:hypothetical protein